MSEKREKIQEQENVLNVNGESAIVSASAGSGKTTVMVAKILKYINEGFSLKNILALTFTNQAASQMKAKIAKEIEQFVEEKQNLELLEQIEILPQADISTFHSFYEKIVKKYFYIAGIEPNFEIISSEKLSSLKENAFKKAVEKLKSNCFEKYIELCDVLGKKRSDTAIKEKIFKLDDFLSSQHNPKSWIENVSCILYKNQNETLSMFFSEIFGSVKETKNKLCSLLEKAKQNCEDGLCEHINNCILLLDEITIEDFNDVYKKVLHFTFPMLKKSKKIEETETFYEVREVKKQFTEVCSDIKQLELGSFENIIKSFENCKNNISKIIELYCDFKSILDEEKHSINSFDFSDLETFCLQILENESVREEIKNRYKLIFVDEFQDINPMQYAILELISNNNVLFVGDAKQSIYGFRQSDVEIFVDVCKSFKEKENSKSLLLNCNFRTNEKILNFANEVFKILMTQNSCEIKYEQDSMFNAKSLNSCEDESVKIVGICEEEKEDKKEETEIFEIFKQNRNFNEISLEAKAILNEVYNVIDKEIFIDKKSKKVNFGDIAILVKNRSKLLYDVVSLFSKTGIPFIVNDDFDLFECKEVQLANSLLSLCVNRNDDFSLATVFASYFGKLTYDELAEIKLKTKSEFFFERASEYCKQNNDSISKKISSFNTLIDELCFNIQIFGASAALEKLFEKNGFYEFVFGLENGQDRVEKIKQFLKHIDETGFSFDIVNLVEYLKSVKSIKLPSLKKCDDNAICITTIHASKGLEFPVVILGDCGKDFTKGKPEQDDLKIEKNLGLALKNYNREERKVYNSIFKRIIEISAKKQEIAENLRLLYVALTRAKCKLIITGKIPESFDKITKETNLLFVKPTYMNYICGAIQNKPIDGTKIEIVSNVEERKVEQQKEDLTPILEAQNKIKFNYKNIENCKLSLKTSVSEIAFEDEYGSVVSTPKNFEMSEHLTNFSTAEEGTIIHEILERVDFDSDTLFEDVKQLVEKQDVIDKKILFETVFENIKLLRVVLPKENKTFKEKQFMIFASPFEIFGNGAEEKILVQGKLDLISVGNKNILIDYKYTSITDEERLIDKYKKQLLTYAFAAKNALGKDIDEIYLLSLKSKKLIKIK